MDAAESHLREAIRLQTRFPAAYGRLATLLRGKCTHDDLQAIEWLLSDPGLGPHPRARLSFALAHVLDARREFSRAASCLSEANSLTLETRRAEGLIYKPDDHDRFVEQLIRSFDHDFFRRAAGLGLETHRPVFIFGRLAPGRRSSERSSPAIPGSTEPVNGSSAGGRSKGCHPSLVSMLRRRSASPRWRNTPQEARRGASRQAQLAGFGSVERIVDKLPDNSLYAGLLVAMFPNAVFIHCRRDLRNVAVSRWMSDFRSIAWANDPTHIGRRFRQYRRLTSHWSGASPRHLRGQL